VERHLAAPQGEGRLRPGDAVVVSVDSGYSHDYTSAQVHHFLAGEYGPDYFVRNAARFAAFEDHRVYVDEMQKPTPFAPKIERLRGLQREFQRHTACATTPPSMASPLASATRSRARR